VTPGVLIHSLIIICMTSARKFCRGPTGPVQLSSSNAKLRAVNSLDTVTHLRVCSQFTIQYGAWLLPAGNPVLGTPRNEAGKTATGSIMINMDNDDVYSPDFVAYIVHHIHENGWSQITVKLHSGRSSTPTAR